MAARQVTAADIMGAAVHEASHAVAAEAFGAGPAVVTLEVKRNASGDSWISGSTSHKAAAGRNGITLALAGGIAEVLHGGSAWRFARGNEFHRVLGEKISTSDRRNAELAAGRPIEVADIAEAERWVRANLPAIEARALAEASAFSDRQRGVTAQASRPAAAARPAADDDFSVSVWVHGKFVDAKNMGDLGRLMAEAARWRGPGSAGAW